MPTDRLPDDVAHRVMVRADRARSAAPVNAETTACTCWRLTKGLLTLPDGDPARQTLEHDWAVVDESDPPADHFPCLHTMQRTVAAWVGERQAEWRLELLNNTEPAIAPATLRDLLAIGTKHRLRWPYRVRGRPLLAVIRQWAIEHEEQALKSLGRSLDGDERWRAQVEQMRRILAGELPDRHYRVADTSLKHKIGDGAEEYAIAWRLARVGLPYSPIIAQRLRAQARGVEAPAPRRGLLVETRVYALESRKTRQLWIHDGHPEVTIVGDLAFAPVPLVEQAARVARVQKEWLEDAAHHPFLVPGTVHAWPAGGERETTEYLAAVQDPEFRARVLEHVRCAPKKRAWFIKKEVDRMFETVRWRRRSNHLEPKPPRGARRAARDDLSAWLKDQGA